VQSGATFVATFARPNGTIKFDEIASIFKISKACWWAFRPGQWALAFRPEDAAIDFAAPNLDLQYLLTQIDPELADFYDNLEAVEKVRLARGRYKSFEFSDLKTDAPRSPAMVDPAGSECRRGTYKQRRRLPTGRTMLS
jgi:hypothetical protein